VLTQPSLERAQHVPPFVEGELVPARDAVPLLETSATAAGRGVLRDEHRMTAKGSLLAIVVGLRGRETAVDEFRGVVEDRDYTILTQVLELALLQGEAAAKSRVRQTREHLVKVAHRRCC